MSDRTVVLVGTLDTKGAEYAYMRDRLNAHDIRTVLVDVGTLEPPLTEPDIDRRTVAAAAGVDLDELVRERDLVRFATHGGGHRQRRAGRHPVVATGPVDDVRAQPDARDTVILPVDPGGSLVRLLVHAVVVDRMAVGILGHANAVAPVVDGG